jgi:ABC-type branched-subunit amino acid transport system substrate-binding protein
LLVSLAAVGCGSKDSPDTTQAEGAAEPTAEVTSLTSASSGDPFVVGASFDTAGPGRVAGQPLLDGFLAAIDGINGRGGVDGHPVELVIRDDQTAPAQAATAMRDIAGSGASLAVGFAASVAAASAAEVAEEVEVPLLSVAIPTAMLESDLEYPFSSTVSVNGQGRAELDFIRGAADTGELPQDPVIAAFHLATPGGEGWIEAMKIYATELGFSIDEAVSIELAAADASGQAARLVNAEPDVIMLYATSGEILTLASALRSAGLATDTMLITYSFAGGATMMKSIADIGFEQYVAVSNWRLANDPDVGSDYLADLAAAGVDPEIPFVQDGYAYGLIAASVLADCGFPCDGPAAREAFEALNAEIPIAFGPVTFSTLDREGVSVLRFTQLVDGELTYVGDPVAVG